MKKRGRPRKYATQEESAEAKRLRDITYWHERRAKLRSQGLLPVRQVQFGPVNPYCEEIVRPPREVLAERDFRYELISAMSAGEQHTSTPPIGYSAHYYMTAWRHQRRLARGG